jgi:hypothetical protein
LQEQTLLEHDMSINTSAAEAYKAEQRKTLDLLSAFSAKLAGHQMAQSKDQKNWGYVGDLQHINSLLRQALGEEQ